MRRIVFLISLACFAVLSVSAQDSPNTSTAALRAMLAITPDTPEARAYWQFADFAAARAATADYAYDSIEAFLADLDANPDQARTALAALPLSDSLRRLDPDTLPDFAAINGFDFFALDQVVNTGVPPAHGFIIRGDLERESLDSALSAWEDVEQFGFSGWCSPDGCDAGMMSDLRGVIAGSFYDNIGRKPPMLFNDETRTLFYAYSNLILETLADAQSGADTLADAPEFEAMAAGLDDYAKSGALIRTALSFDPAMLTEVDVPLEGTRIPIPQAVMLVDSSDSAAQVTAIVLAYADQASAVEAGDVVLSNLQTLISPRTEQTYEAVFQAHGGILTDPTIVQGTAGAWAVLIPIVYPLPQDLTTPFDVFRAVYDMFASDDLAFLAAE